MAYRRSLMKCTEKYGVSRASRKYNKSRSYIYFWKARWDGTAASLACRSRRPHSHPSQHTGEELKLIRDMRRRWYPHFSAARSKRPRQKEDPVLNDIPADYGRREEGFFLHFDSLLYVSNLNFLCGLGRCKKRRSVLYIKYPTCSFVNPLNNFRLYNGKIFLCPKMQRH